MSRQSNESISHHANHQEILELVGIAVITIDAMGTVVETNAAAAIMFGHDDEQMIGRNVTLLMPEQHARNHDAYLQRHLSTGQSRIIGEGRKVDGLRADGTVFPMHLAVGRFERDGQVYFTGIVHDLTDQENVIDRASRFGRIIDESLNEIFVFDATSLNFTLINRGALLNLGYSAEELLVMTPVDIKPEFTETRFRELIHPLLRGDQSRLHFQTVHERKDGSRYDVDVVLSIADTSPVADIVAIVQDNTERNRLTAAFNQAQKMEAMGMLTGGLAHDFNNLLTVISGNLELLEMQLTEADQRELVTEARTATSLGADLTRRLLSFARKSRLKPSSVDLNDAILSLSVLVRRSLGSRISLNTSLAPEIGRVSIDAALFDSALMNLAINARDAMAEGGELTIETGCRQLSRDEALAFDLPAAEYAVVTVRDTGHGIEADQLAKVFDPFYTTRASSGGTGLGLSMVYGFARQSGGHVSVKSELGDGSEFTIWIPQSTTDQAGDSDEDDATGLMAEMKPLKVLLVDDDAGVRRLTERRLQSLGHEVITAMDGPAALASYREASAIDLLLTDMVMPGGLSGYQLAMAIREHDADLPVIIASGYSEQIASLEASPDAGLYLLRKPYDLSALNHLLRRIAGLP